MSRLEDNEGRNFLHEICERMTIQSSQIDNDVLGVVDYIMALEERII